MELVNNTYLKFVLYILQIIKFMLVLVCKNNFFISEIIQDGYK